MVEHDDENFFIAGNQFTQSGNNVDWKINKINGNGSIMDDGAIYDMDDNDNYLTSISETFSGNLVLGGTLGPHPHYNRIHIKKISSDNYNVLWQYTHYDEGYTTWANSIIQTSDGGYLIAGGLATGLSNGYLLKMDSDELLFMDVWILKRIIIVL